MINLSEVYIGVDVSKAKLDIHIFPLKKTFTIKNNKVEINKFIKTLTIYQVMQVACESTGGYQNLLIKLLQKKQYKTWIIDPRRIKAFIVATGFKVKTDKIDAEKIAEFAAKNFKDYDSYCRSMQEEQLLALINRRDDLMKFLTIEKIRLKNPSHNLSLVSITNLIKCFEKEIKAIDQQIQDLIQQDKILNEKSKILESIPGIGKTSAAVLLSFVPELGNLSNKQVSALIGVCPYDNQSGKYNGKKTIRGGRSAPRNQLYMCALSAIKHCAVLKEFYNRLTISKKPFKVAMVAIMHKLIIIANTLLKKGELCRV